jgi:hypothetical protein
MKLPCFINAQIKITKNGCVTVPGFLHMEVHERVCAMGYCGSE